MKTLEKTNVSRKASARTETINRDNMKLIRTLAAKRGQTANEWLCDLLSREICERVEQGHNAGIVIRLPDQMKEFLSDAYHAAGLDFSDYIDSYADLIRREVEDTFTTRASGVRENLLTNKPECRPALEKVITRWRGRFEAE
jgi:flagellar biosynthesis component FlhA